MQIAMSIPYINLVTKTNVAIRRKNSAETVMPMFEEEDLFGVEECKSLL